MQIDMQALVDAEIARLQNPSFRREGQPEPIVGSEAATAAETSPNVQTEGQNSLKTGDIIFMPKDDAQFEKWVIAQRFSDGQVRPSIGLILPVLRKGTYIAVRVFSNAFSRGFRKLKTAAVPAEGDNPGSPAVFEKEMTYPGGKPAQDFRDTPGSIKDCFRSLYGKVIKVDNVAKIDCEVVDYSAKVAEGESRPLIVGNRKMHSFSYTTTPSDGTDAPAAASADGADAPAAGRGGRGGK
jgi:hypothetical protein